MSTVTTTQAEAVRAVARIDNTAKKAYRNSSICLAILAIMIILVIIFFAILYFQYNTVLDEIGNRVRDQVVWRNINLTPGSVGAEMTGENMTMTTVISGSNPTSITLQPSSALVTSPIGSQIMIVNKSSAVVTVTPGTGVTLNPSTIAVASNRSYLLVKVNSEAWNLVSNSANAN